MADVKWIKILVDIFDDEKILFIEQLPDADSIIVIWFKLLTLSGKINNGGVMLFRDKMPYTDEMLSTIFRRPVNTIRLAIKTFETFGMVEIVNNTLTIPNWSKHQSLDQLESKKEYMRTYMQDYREKQKQLAEGKETCKTNSKTNSKANSKANVSLLEEELELELELDRDKEEDTSSKYSNIINEWNQLGLAQIKSIKSNRLKMVQARLKEFSLEETVQAIKSINNSSFLKGQNKNNWVITFDWFIKPNNFVKVLEGNYLDKGVNNNELENRGENRGNSGDAPYDYDKFFN